MICVCVWHCVCCSRQCCVSKSMLNSFRLRTFGYIVFIIFHVSSIIDPLTTLFTNVSSIQALRFGHEAYRRISQDFSSALVVIVNVFCMLFSASMFLPANKNGWHLCLSLLDNILVTNLWMLPFTGESLIAQTKWIYWSARIKRLNHVIDHMIMFVKSVCGLHFNCSLLASIGRQAINSKWIDYFQNSMYIGITSIETDND